MTDYVQSTLSTTTNSIGDFNKDFQKYSSNTTLISVAAGVCIGLATKEIIQSLMNETILPLLQFMIKTSLYYWAYMILLKLSLSKPVINKILETIGTIIWLFLLWSVIIFISFVLFKKLLNYNLISMQIGNIHKLGGYGLVLEEKIKQQFQKIY
jgi:large-conductance mechanosensitive channel